MNAISGAGPVDNSQSPHSLWRTLPLSSVRMTEGFWAARRRVNREVSLGHGYAQLEATQTLRNLRIAAGLESGAFTGFWFADSDVYKWLEAAAWELGNSDDANLRAQVESTVALIAAAQQADGYLDSYFQIEKPSERWKDMDHGHELYCAGHLIQAAVALVRADGDSTLMAVALHLVDHIHATFGPGGRDETCGHPEIEMALVELYRTSRDPRHLELAQLLIDRRGRNRMRGHAGYGAIYQQDHIPLRAASEVAGHAVRQLYLTTGATDLVLETGDAALLAAMHNLWADMTERKLYVTGGVGSRFDGESFGGPYELPSDTCYCETCAAIASLMWNWRLLLLTGDGRFADLFERTLYNGVLASPGLEGCSYLYVNPLLVRGGRYVRASTDTAGGAELSRPAWHSCACCPPNVMRLFSSLQHYVATASPSGVQIHQYAGATLDVELVAGRVGLRMQTDYPWQGDANLLVDEAPATAWRLSLRVPAWAPEFALTLNGDPLPAPLVEAGYLHLDRVWQAGARVELHLVLAARWLLPHPRVDAVRGSLALLRGPLVYCFEEQDQPS
ncbi:MAG: glycoside hydrolase family 127 protein, partial [Caldilineaceae bacterium]